MNSLAAFQAARPCAGMILISCALLVRRSSHTATERRERKSLPPRSNQALPSSISCVVLAGIWGCSSQFTVIEDSQENGKVAHPRKHNRISAFGSTSILDKTWHNARAVTTHNGMGGGALTIMMVLHFRLSRSVTLR